jgi:hypothetical protein
MKEKKLLQLLKTKRLIKERVAFFRQKVQIKMKTLCRKEEKP